MLLSRSCIVLRCFEHDKGKTHSSGKLLYSARIIPYRGSWLDFEFDPKDSVYVRIDRRRKLPATVLLRALGYTTEDILNMFYESDTFVIKPSSVTLKAQPTRLRGELAVVDITDVNGKVLVEEGRRISGRHVRMMQKAIEQSGVNEIEFPDGYIFNKKMAHALIDEETGEELAHANQEITEELLSLLREKNISEIQTLYINEIECGSYISDTLSIDVTKNQLEALVEIYRIMRQGEPPTKDAAESLLRICFCKKIVMSYLESVE